MVTRPTEEPLPDPADRIRALTDLAEQLKPNPDGRPPDMRALVGLLSCIRQDTDSAVVLHAIQLLSRLKPYSAVALMIDVALATKVSLYRGPSGRQFRETEDSHRLRGAAIQALGRMGDGRAIVPLMDILNNPKENYRVRLAAAESLGKLGDAQAMRPLLNILSDERENSVYLKESVVKALGMLGDIRALEPLIDVLESKQGFRNKFNFLKEQVILSIGRIGRSSRRATDSLMAALQDESPTIRVAAIDALAELGDEDCLPALMPLITDPEDDVVRAVIPVLFQLGGEVLLRDLLVRDTLPQWVRDELEGYIP